MDGVENEVQGGVCGEAMCRSRHGRKRKPFGGATVDAAHDQLSRKASASLVTPPLWNKIIYSIEGYLDNISTAATQVLENGGPLPEFSSRLAVLVDTVAVQAKDIKSLYQQINALKKKGAPKPSIKTNEGGGMTGNVCPHCDTVGHWDPHKKGSCYFNSNKTTERRE